MKLIQVVKAFDDGSAVLTTQDGATFKISSVMIEELIAARIEARSKVEAYRVYGTDTDGSERMFTVVDATSAAEALAKAAARGYTTLTEAVLWK